MKQTANYLAVCFVREKMYIYNMAKNVILLAIVLSLLFVGCSNCHDYTDDYAVVESDSTFIAFAEPFKTDTSIYPKEGMLSYSRFSNGEALTAIVYYDYIKLFVDIFGCRTRHCKEASSVVIHNSDYSYMELFHPPQFEISKANESRQINDDYEEKVIDFLFHLNLKTDSIFISWDVEVGKGKYEHCRAPLNPGW